MKSGDCPGSPVATWLILCLVREPCQLPAVVTPWTHAPAPAAALPDGAPRVRRSPEWRQSDLPQPPPYTFGNVVRVIGPGAILLGLSLGSGDWILGPAATARWCPGILWICTISVLLQALLNTEMARYTLATGESIFAGFMRVAPGPRVWGPVYALLHLGRVGRVARHGLDARVPGGPRAAPRSLEHLAGRRRRLRVALAARGAGRELRLGAACGLRRLL